jgi:hypothetical protein
MITTNQTILLLITLLLGCSNTDNNMFEFLKKKGVKEIYSSLDYNVIFDNNTFDNTPIELLNIGNLKVPSGRIVVCDPLVMPDTKPLSLKVKQGEYPIKLYVAKTKDSGDRYAIAKLEFSNKRAEKWVLAIHDGDDISTLKNNDEFFGFPVDAGLAGFFDFQAGVEYNKFYDNFLKNNPQANIYDDFFAKEFKKNARQPENPQDDGDWINFNIPNTDLNITMFQSGYGDGTYPAYWGMTKDNEIVSLVIDFLVLLPPENK